MHPVSEEELIVTEQVDFSSLLFGNPVTFLAFLAEVIKQTISGDPRIKVGEGGTARPRKK